MRKITLESNRKNEFYIKDNFGKILYYGDYENFIEMKSSNEYREKIINYLDQEGKKKILLKKATTYK